MVPNNIVEQIVRPSPNRASISSRDAGTVSPPSRRGRASGSSTGRARLPDAPNSPVAPLYEGELLCGPLYASLGPSLAVSVASPRSPDRGSRDSNGAESGGTRWVGRWVSATTTSIRIWADYQSYTHANSNNEHNESNPKIVSRPLVTIDLAEASVLMGSGYNNTSSSAASGSAPGADSSLSSSNGDAKETARRHETPTPYCFRLLSSDLLASSGPSAVDDENSVLVRFCCESFPVLNDWYGTVSKWANHARAQATSRLARFGSIGGAADIGSDDGGFVRRNLEASVAAAAQQQPHEHATDTEFTASAVRSPPPSNTIRSSVGNSSSSSSSSSGGVNPVELMKSPSFYVSPETPAESKSLRRKTYLAGDGASAQQFNGEVAKPDDDAPTLGSGIRQPPIITPASSSTPAALTNAVLRFSTADDGGSGTALQTLRQEPQQQQQSGSDDTAQQDRTAATVNDTTAGNALISSFTTPMVVPSTSVMATNEAIDDDDRGNYRGGSGNNTSAGGSMFPSAFPSAVSGAGYPSASDTAAAGGSAGDDTGEQGWITPSDAFNGTSTAPGMQVMQPQKPQRKKSITRGRGVAMPSAAPSAAAAAAVTPVIADQPAVQQQQQEVQEAAAPSAAPVVVFARRVSMADAVGKVSDIDAGVNSSIAASFNASMSNTAPGLPASTGSKRGSGAGNGSSLFPTSSLDNSFATNVNTTSNAMEDGGAAANDRNYDNVVTSSQSAYRAAPVAAAPPAAAGALSQQQPTATASSSSSSPPSSSSPYVFPSAPSSSSPVAPQQAQQQQVQQRSFLPSASAYDQPQQYHNQQYGNAGRNSSVTSVASNIPSRLLAPTASRNAWLAAKQKDDEVRERDRRLREQEELDARTWQQLPHPTSAGQSAQAGRPAVARRSSSANPAAARTRGRNPAAAPARGPANPASYAQQQRRQQQDGMQQYQQHYHQQHFELPTESSSATGAPSAEVMNASAGVGSGMREYVRSGPGAAAHNGGVNTSVNSGNGSIGNNGFASSAYRNGPTLMERTQEIGHQALMTRVRSPSEVSNYRPNRSDAFHRAQGIPAPSSSLKSFQYHTGYERPGWQASALGGPQPALGAFAAPLEGVHIEQMMASHFAQSVTTASAAVLGAGAPASKGLVAPVILQPTLTASGADGGNTTATSAIPTDAPVSVAVPRLSRIRQQHVHSPRRAGNMSTSRVDSNGTSPRFPRNEAANHDGGVTSGDAAARHSAPIQTSLNASGAAEMLNSLPLRALSPGSKRQVMWAGQTWPAAEAQVLAAAGLIPPVQRARSSPRRSPRNALLGDQRAHHHAAADEANDNSIGSLDGGGAFPVFPLTPGPSDRNPGASDGQQLSASAARQAATASPVSSLLLEHISEVESRLRQAEEEKEQLKAMLSAGRDTLQAALGPTGASSSSPAGTTAELSVANNSSSRASPAAVISSSSSGADASNSGVIDRVLHNPGEVSSRLSLLQQVARSVTESLGGHPGMTPTYTSRTDQSHLTTSSPFNYAGQQQQIHQLQPHQAHSNVASGMTALDLSHLRDHQHQPIRALPLSMLQPALQVEQQQPYTGVFASSRAADGANASTFVMQQQRTASSPGPVALAMAAAAAASAATDRSHVSIYQQQIPQQHHQPDFAGAASHHSNNTITGRRSSIAESVFGASGNASMFASEQQQLAVSGTTRQPSTLADTLASLEATVTGLSSKLTADKASAAMQQADAQSQMGASASASLSTSMVSVSARQAQSQPQHLMPTTSRHEHENASVMNASILAPAASAADDGGLHRGGRLTSRSIVSTQEAAAEPTHRLGSSAVVPQLLPAAGTVEAAAAPGVHHNAYHYAVLLADSSGPVIGSVVSASSTELTIEVDPRHHPESSSAGVLLRSVAKHVRLVAPHQEDESYSAGLTFDHVFRHNDTTSAYSIHDALTALRLPRSILTVNHRATIVVTVSGQTSLNSGLALLFGSSGNINTRNGQQQQQQFSNSSSSSAGLFHEAVAQSMVASLSGSSGLAGAEATFTVRAVAESTAGPAFGSHLSQRSLLDVLLPPSRRNAPGSRPPTLQQPASPSSSSAAAAAAAGVLGAVGVRVVQASECSRLCNILSTRTEAVLSNGSAKSVVVLADCERGGQPSGTLVCVLQMAPGDARPATRVTGSATAVLAGEASSNNCLVSVVVL